MTPYRTLQHIPAEAYRFWRRLCVTPFQVALAITTVMTGIMSFFDATITAQLFKDALPNGMVIIFNIVYVLAGVLMIAGIGWAYRNLEASSLILLIMSLIVRFIALAVEIGFVSITITALIQSFVFGFACATKLIILLKRKDVVLVDLDHHKETLTGEHAIASSAVSR